jgi:hypothetical protein
MDLRGKKFNVIGEVMNDGQGDWGWVFTITNILLNKGVRPGDINIIFINAYDFGQNMKKALIMLIKYLKNLNCIDINPDTLKQLDAIIKNETIINFLLNDTFNIENNKKTIMDFTGLLNTIYNMFNSRNISNVYNILKELNTGYNFNKDLSNISTTDKKKLCYTKRIDEFNILDSIKYEPGSVLFPINAMTKITEIEPNFKTTNHLKIRIFGIIDSIEETLLDEVLSNRINIFFRTQEDNIGLVESILTKKPIIIREGGHSGNNALNCGPEYGYIQTTPKRNEQKLIEFKALNNLPDLKTIHVAYISLGEKEKEIDKLLLFVKILSNIEEISSENTIAIVGNVFNNIFNDIDLQNDVDLINDINTLDNPILTTKYDSNHIKYKKYKKYYNIIKSNITILNKEPNKVKFKYNNNNKILNIIPLPRISMLDNGFDFSYFLEQTNKYCMLSGDMSYMEGLTLGKVVIHVGMSNKFVMINKLKNKIIENFKEPVNDLIKQSYEVIITNDTDIIEYSKFISNPIYLEQQIIICKKDFSETLIETINSILNKSSDSLFDKFITFLNKHNIPIEENINTSLKQILDHEDNYPNLVSLLNYLMSNQYVTKDNITETLKFFNDDDGKDLYDDNLYKEFFDKLKSQHIPLQSLAGGYRTKYLKYKKKYLELKKNINN